MIYSFIYNNDVNNCVSEDVKNLLLSKSNDGSGPPMPNAEGATIEQSSPVINTEVHMESTAPEKESESLKKNAVEASGTSLEVSRYISKYVTIKNNCES